jgi:hypothetical protein
MASTIGKQFSSEKNGLTVSCTSDCPARHERFSNLKACTPAKYCIDYTQVCLAYYLLIFDMIYSIVDMPGVNMKSEKNVRLNYESFSTHSAFFQTKSV